MTKKPRFLIFTGYDKKETKIPLSKNPEWFKDSRGSGHCVVSCYNFADVFYITDYGFASISYCDSHACNRILESMFGDNLERGIWCSPIKGKLIPHWYYKRFLPQFKKLSPTKAKKLESKLRDFTKKEKGKD